MIGDTSFLIFEKFLFPGALSSGLVIMKFFWNSNEYISPFSTSNEDLPSDVDYSEEASFLKNETAYCKPLEIKKLIKTFIWATIANVLLFATSVALFLSWYIPRTQLNPELRQWSYYTPLMDMLDVGKHTETLNGTLFPPDEPSFARQMPNPAADAIWAEIELIRTMPITADQVRKLGKDPEKVAKFDDEYWQLGDDAYMAQFDVFHQIHCVNTLRKLAYPNHYGGGEHKEHAEIWAIHINHCVDIIVQALTCSGNLGMYTLEWRDGQDYPFPDFSINRECIDFQRLLEFRQEVTVDMDMWINMTRPADANVLPMPDQYYEMYNEVKDPKYDDYEDTGA